MKENIIPKGTKDAAKSGVTLFEGKIWKFSANCNICVCPLFAPNLFNFCWINVGQMLKPFKRALNCNGNVKIKKQINFVELTVWFHQQNKFKTQFEHMEVNEMNKCLSKGFYVSVRRKKTSLLTARAALNHHLRPATHLAMYARGNDCDFRRSPRSVYKIVDIWHVRYRRLNSPAFAKYVRSRDFLRSSLRIASKVNKSGWAILSHDFLKSPSMEPGNKVEVPHRHAPRSAKKIARCFRINRSRKSLTLKVTASQRNIFI